VTGLQIIMTQTRSVMMTQTAPMVSRIINRTIQRNCVLFVGSLGGTTSYVFDMCCVCKINGEVLSCSCKHVFALLVPVCNKCS
jgi:hypothetical protein